MATRRGMTLLILSLVMGIGAAYVANGWITSRIMNQAEASEPMDEVVVAAVEIPYGTKVESRHLRTLRLPAGEAPLESSADSEYFEGRVAMSTISRGEILIRNRFAEHLAGSTLSAIVSPQMRAVTVRVDDVVGVAGFLLPGNRVDVVSSRKINRRAEADILLSNLKVLAVDQTTSTDKNEPIIVRAVTLEMTPDQAIDLVKARQEGKIQLTLRNPLDESQHVVAEPEPEPEPVIKVAAAPAPKPAPRPVHRVTIIRGTHVTTVRQSP